MELITRIPVAKSDFPIDYDSKILSLGSCFALNMAEKFAFFQFQSLVNPFGILFHPVAIEKFLRFSVDGKKFAESDIFNHNESWHCFDAHSDLSAPDAGRLVNNLQRATEATKTFLSEATHIIITLGTAWVYRENASGNLVANCHKVPQKNFSKELLSVSEIVESLESTIGLIKSVNPSAKIIFTVSPVRHIKDGFVESQRSKSHLITALHQVLDDSSSHQPPNTSHQTPIYFPSYEILLDELRDYRFYANDLLHPNQLAIDYIWEKFAESHIAPDAFPVMDEVANIRKAMTHRAFNPDSESHKKFLKATADKVSSLQKRFPHMHF